MCDHRYLREILSAEFGGKLAVLGGIQINLGSPALDRFLPLCFEVYDPAVGKAVDLLPQVTDVSVHSNSGVSQNIFPLP